MAIHGLKNKIFRAFKIAKLTMTKLSTILCTHTKFGENLKTLVTYSKILSIFS